MREILFRAKRLDNGEWVEGYYEKYNNQHYINKETDRLNTGGYPIREFIEVDENTICQFTELYDKNGNKIWENDVVKDNVIFGKVVWVDKYAGFMINDVFDGNQDYSDWWQEVKVIGNIFDNPELLEGGVD